MTDWLGGVHKTCAPVSLIPSFLPFLQASQLSPFPLDSSPSSFPLLGTHGPSCRASSRARRPIRHLRDYPQLEKLARKKKKGGGWAEKRRGGSAGAWCGGRGIRPKAVGGRKPSREGRRPGLRGRRWNNTEDGSRSRARGGHGGVHVSVIAGERHHRQAQYPLHGIALYHRGRPSRDRLHEVTLM